MAQRPLIGVTGAAKLYSPSWWCTRLAVFCAGGKAVRISTTTPQPDCPMAGMIIGGGDDIHPSLYEEEPAHNDYDRERDALEINFIHHSLKLGLPLLGICRGMQLINIVRGGTLFLDINPARRKTSRRQIILPRKTVHLTQPSKLSDVLQRSSIKVNSLHHQAVRELGRELRASALDLDEFVQAFESTDNDRIFGVQWHPEYLFYLPNQLRLFRWLVQQSRHNAQ